MDASGYSDTLKFKILIEQSSNGEFSHITPLDPNVKYESSVCLSTDIPTYCPSCAMQLNAQIDVHQFCEDSQQYVAEARAGSLWANPSPSLSSSLSAAEANLSMNTTLSIDNSSTEADETKRKFSMISGRAANSTVRPDFLFQTKEDMHRILMQSDYFYSCLRKRSADGLEFTPNEAGKLIRMILRCVMNYSLQPISSGEFSLMARHIQDLFPLEKKELYYYSNQRETSGRLYTAFQQIKRELKEYGFVEYSTSKNKKVKLEEPEVKHEIEHGIDSEIDKIRKLTEPFHEVLELWQQTYPKRLQILRSCNTLSHYIDLFACLNENTGVSLLIGDVNQFLSSEPGISLKNGVKEFKATAVNVLTALITEKHNEKDVKTIAQSALVSGNRELMELTALCYFAHIFTAVARSRSGFNESAKPGKAQMQELFVPHFGTEEEVQSFLSKINELIEIKKNTERLHAIGFIVGNLSDPQSLTFVLKLLHIEYRLKNIWQGVDLLFKLFLLFKTDFPSAAHSVWSFFGHKYYGLMPPTEVLNKASYRNARLQVEAKLKN